jgi:hypothetical protein
MRSTSQRSINIGALAAPRKERFEGQAVVRHSIMS